MFLILAHRVRDAVAAHIRRRYETDVTVVIEQPRQSDFGELALPVCFSLAKTLKRAPRQIAEEMVAELPAIDGVASFEVAGGGYINVRFDRGAYGEALLQQTPSSVEDSPQKIIIEHTNINPNKAAHIGHLRNAVMGDTLVRMLRRLGNTVEVQNYIDNTGVQVADVVVGFHFLEGKSPEQVQALVDDPEVRFDYYCWDLYARTSQHYKDNPESLDQRAETLHAIEAGEGALAEDRTHRLKRCCRTSTSTRCYASAWSTTCCLAKARFCIYGSGSAAFALLKERGAVVLETERQEQRTAGLCAPQLFQDPDKKRLKKPKKKEADEEQDESKPRIRTKSSSARTAPSLTSARTSPTNFGSSG